MEMFDIVIVGAGPAGAIAADALAQKNFNVLILEAGPDEQDRGALMERYLADPSKSLHSPYPDNSQAPRPSTTEPNGYYVQTGADMFASSYERRVGGTTWHWHGICPRFLPSDFRMHSTYGVGVDWPISYDDLEPWYEVAEQELGISGDASDDHGSPRKAEFPFPAQRQSESDKLIDKAITGKTFNNVGLSVTPHRAARNPEICQGSGSCMPLCPTGAKYEALLHANSAQERGAVLRAKSVATKLVAGADNNIEALHYKDWDGKEHEVRAKRFILAANAIETPKLLLMSPNDNGGTIANSSDQVGRNLMDHPAQITFAQAPERVDAYEGPQSTSAIASFRNGEHRENEGGFWVEIFNTGGGVFGGPDRLIDGMIKEGLSGKALRNAVAATAGKEMMLLSEMEQLPDPNNRVSLSEKVDALGIPRPQIHYAYGDYSLKAVETIKKLHEYVYTEIGTGGFFHLPFLVGGGHIMGTTRMGDDPATSVVDANLQSHDHNNLYIVGAGVYPTGATANPTLTIAALSLRLADHIANL